MTKEKAGGYFNQLAKKQDIELRAAKKYTDKPESKLLKRTMKLESLKVGSTKKLRSVMAATWATVKMFLWRFS